MAHISDDGEVSSFQQFGSELSGTPLAFDAADKVLVETRTELGGEPLLGLWSPSGEQRWATPLGSGAWLHGTASGDDSVFATGTLGDLLDSSATATHLSKNGEQLCLARKFHGRRTGSTRTRSVVRMPRETALCAATADSFDLV